jgi:hypothetical protein
MSRQKLHSPQSDLLQASHFLHLVRRRRGPLLLLACDEELLPARLIDLGGVSDCMGRFGRCMERGDELLCCNGMEPVRLERDELAPVLCR